MSPRRTIVLCAIGGVLATGAAPSAAGAAAFRIDSGGYPARAAGVFDPPPPAPSAPAPSVPAPRPAEPAKPRRTVRKRLSNERTLSRWAYVERRVAARRRPSRRSRIVKTLRTATPDGTPEVVLLLAQVTLPNGAKWVKVRLPMRPNGRTGWVPRRGLGGYRRVRTFLAISRGRTRADLYRSGRRIWSARLGVGKRGTATPGGNFYIRERLIPAGSGSIYGVFAFGMSAYSNTLTDWPGGGMVGLHGTNQPGLIPGRISHGCVRVRNEKISVLRRLMPLGTPVRIR